MSSWFSSGPALAPGANFHSVALAYDQSAYYGPLVPQDTEWLCAGGFVTETQIFYATTATGGLVMVQVIHSSVGVWYPSIQFTFRYFEPSKNISIWKSTPVTNFVVGPDAKLDKRSSKSDQFSITVDPSTPTKYTVQGKYDDEVQVSITVEQLASGFKVGAGPRGGMSYFGKPVAPTSAAGAAPDVTGGSDGYTVHRFWPRCAFSGIIRTGTDVVDLADARGMFVHAIQGLRPNVLAARWNFADFQSSKDDRAALVLMEFTTTPAYGSKKVNVGGVVVDDKLVSVVAGGDGVVGGSSVEHLAPLRDEETGYDAPGQISYLWQGATLFGDERKASEDAPRTKANILLDLATSKAGEPYGTKGLIEKVDVLGQIPYLVKKFVNYAAGTKPYIYTWLNPTTATISVPEDLSSPSGPKTKTIEVKGNLFCEATFIS